MPYIQGVDKMQATLPETLENYVSEGNEVRVIDAFVESLNMKDLGFLRAEAASTGRPGFRPQDMLKLYLYGFLNRVRSSRRLESECQKNVEVMWLLNKLTPDYKTIADFRRDNSIAMKQVFSQFVVTCRDWDLFSKEILAIDGSKIRASNSKRRNYSKKKLARHIKYIDEKINEYMRILDDTDTEERNTKQLTTDEIQGRIKELLERKDTYEKMKKQMDESESNQISTVDPDAKLMASSNNGVDVSYNVQATVDSKHNLVADIEVINNASDSGQLYPMASRAKEILDMEEITVLVDKGYSNNYQDLMACEKNGITTYAAIANRPSMDGGENYRADKFKYNEQDDTFTCPQGQILKYYRTREMQGLKHKVYRNYSVCKGCLLKDQCTKSKKGRTINRSEAAKTIDNIVRRMQENPQLYKRRQMIVEPVFGTVKRAIGFTYFLTRGIKKVNAEAALAFCAYNLRRVINIMGVDEMIRRLRIV